jgi:hypothetical protein
MKHKFSGVLSGNVFASLGLFSGKAAGSLTLPPRFEVENFDFKPSHSALERYRIALRKSTVQQALAAGLLLQAHEQRRRGVDPFPVLNVMVFGNKFVFYFLLMIKVVR